MRTKSIPSLLFLLLSGSVCLFSSRLAGQQPFGTNFTRTRPFTTVDDVLNREAEAPDSAGIRQYSEDIIGLVVSNRVGSDFLNSLTDRLAKAEQSAREGRGRLVPEEEIVRVFNGLMLKIKAPPSFKTDVSAVRQFRARSIAVRAFPALLSASRNGTSCNPAEAFYLLHLLLWNDGTLSEHLLDDLVEYKRVAEERGGFSTFSANITSAVTIHQSAGVLLSDYSSNLSRRAAVKLFNGVAREFGF